MKINHIDVVIVGNYFCDFVNQTNSIYSGIDTIGLVNEVTKIISNNHNINMINLHFESDDGVFNGNIAVVVKNITILE